MMARMVRAKTTLKSKTTSQSITKTKSSEMSFKLFAPQAARVSVAGSFNNWDTSSFIGKKDSKGNWIVKASLKPGSYEYKFFVDGSWLLDPQCKSNVCNSFGTQNSKLIIK
ncbi:MAG: isoamylase early set domain-containing protein [Candidatus Omnitrophota bacterium]|jgi:1,4-alpha-glucan branching enzyme